MNEKFVHAAAALSAELNQLIEPPADPDDRTELFQTIHQVVYSAFARLDADLTK